MTGFQGGSFLHSTTASSAQLPKKTAAAMIVLPRAGLPGRSLQGIGEASARLGDRRQQAEDEGAESGREHHRRGGSEGRLTLDGKLLGRAGRGRCLDAHHASPQRTGAAFVIKAPNRPAIAAARKAPTNSSSTIVRRRLSATRLRP